jgi:hypothetical protein
VCLNFFYLCACVSQVPFWSCIICVYTLELSFNVPWFKVFLSFNIQFHWTHFHKFPQFSFHVHCTLNKSKVGVSLWVWMCTCVHMCYITIQCCIICVSNCNSSFLIELILCEVYLCSCLLSCRKELLQLEIQVVCIQVTLWRALKYRIRTPQEL